MFFDWNDWMKRIVIGMTAHVDAGKTTLSEAMLYRSGEIRKLGRVDKGDAFLDTFEIERNRGITVFSKQAMLRYNGDIFTLLDTPGHVDFSAETERALQVLDCAVLVISGIDGVQSHTETISRLLAGYKIPTFIFINKMDISHFSREELMLDLNRKLGGKCVDFDPKRDKDKLYDELALLDENVMNSFLETGNIPDNEIAAAVSERRVFPCYFGSALKMQGISELLDGLSEYIPEPVYGNEFGAKIFKITEDDRGSRLTHMKITGGSLKVRSLIPETDEKVSQIRIYSGTKYSTAEEAPAGTVCAVTGLAKTYAGEGLGFERTAERPVLEPVLSYKVILPPDADIHTALTCLRKLEEEDPQLKVTLNEQLNEIHIRLMGEIQLEILKTVISDRFGMDVSFGNGTIAYKETIASPAEGVGHYEPLRHYAEVHLLLEPAERGSGLHFASDCREEVLSLNFQRLVLTHLEEKQHLGVLTGSPITDMRITLRSGKAHIKHTEGGDFRQAVYRAVRQGLRSAESILLEPWYNFTLDIPQTYVGRAMTDLQNRSAELSPPLTVGENAVISGSAPVSEMQDYQSEVTAYTGGKGRLSMEVKGYFPCHNTEKVVEEIAYDADSDIDNSANSIFCSHGAGYVVKWDEVPEHMHLPSIMKPERNEDEEISQQQISSYRSRLADDDELMAIFERTYGKIDRSPRYAMHTERTAEQKPSKPSPLPKGPEYLLVDGYNIIFAWDELNRLAKDNLDLARNTLINILCNYQGFKQNNVILVFDAYKMKGNHRNIEQVHNISVVYTKEAETADMYIEKVSHELGKDHRVRVATSDGAEQIIILGNGAYRVPASEFHDEVKAVEKAIRSIIETKPHERSTVHEIRKRDKNGDKDNS